MKTRVVHIKVVNSSEVDAACLNALRYTGDCYKCSRVLGCALPEAKAGRDAFYHVKARVMRERMAKTRESLKARIDRINKKLAEQKSKK